MASIQERLQIKREPIDKWSVREQLCLASAVARSGDQNWMSVSRALKPFGDPNRPADWFNQKNCAAQYGALLGNVETPKRKKRLSGTDIIETPAESILKKLLAERKNELKKLLAEEKTEYHKLQEDMVFLQSGKVTEEQLDQWCKEIDEEEHRKEQESIAHNQWLKERELRKQEIERVWRPVKTLNTIIGQKRKHSDSIESLIENEQTEEETTTAGNNSQEPPKPALSPLLTSLLKSPSQVQNVATSSILHSAITNQRTTCANTSSMIANLLNSNSTAVATVSPGLQQLVSSAISQEPSTSLQPVGDENQPLGNDILDDAHLPNLKIDDLANSILVQDGPLPEIKKEEVDDIISEIIENAHDIVTDPEQHLQLDGNGDININLELDDFDDDEDMVEPKEAPKETTKPQEKPVDPFEFQEDPVIFEPSKPSTSKQQEHKQYLPQYQQQLPQVSQPHNQSQPPPLQAIQPQPSPNQSPILPSNQSQAGISSPLKEPEIRTSFDKEIKKEIIEETNTKEKTIMPGSVEIVEVVELEDEEISKQLNRSQIEDIVHSSSKPEPKQEQKPEPVVEIKEEKVDEIEEKPKPVIPETPSEPKTIEVIEESSSSSASEVTLKQDSDIKKEVIDVTDTTPETTTITSDFSEELYDDITMEIKVDKSGKAKRDYSRTKKKEEKDFDVLLAIEKAQLEDSEYVDETFSSDKEYQDADKKDIKTKIKTENDRSNSPWTEEEDVTSIKSKRRYSTPATPIDSVPNSPASSVTYDDDRDYRNWKKSVMLVYNRLVTNKYASLFLKPITDEQAPGYHSVVYRPMDLQTIRKNIESGVIRNNQEFKRDVLLMFNNAIMYNKTNDTVYNMAKQMQQESLQPIEILLQAQSQVETPLRRETRTSESSCKRKRPIEENTKNKKRKED